jgi:carboxymethylenebutenolidase
MDPLSQGTVRADVVIRPAGGRPDELTGFLARPRGDGPWPGVVMVHEAWGLDDVMRQSADRLAGMGFLTLAPDLYGWAGKVRCMIAAIRSLRAGTGRPFADLENCRDWLRERSDCTARVGVVGFCQGGGFALMTANRGFDVSSVNYGLPEPRDLAGAVRGACPVVASYGGRDRGSAGVAGRLEAALSDAGVEHDVKEYPSAGHAFLNAAANGPTVLRPLFARMGSGPEPVAAADAWGRIERFLHRHLDGPVH